MRTDRYIVKITGIVQGVGFRPFIYTLAKSLGLTGWVKNDSGGVIIDAESDRETIELFIQRIRSEAPPLSNIKSIGITNAPYIGYTDFTIKQSDASGASNIYISPDVGICTDCSRELFDRNDRRYLYPFINCTNCGPRLTIVTGVPYDRANTTMNKFAMCARCSSEYRDPSDRRYHAQPVSCHDCGPRLMLLDKSGKKVDRDDIIEYSCQLLIEGNILAVKGLGGYHLACSAHDKNAVLKLRRRKARDEKPFALMVKDLQAASKYCIIGEAEKKLLESEKKPIVLLKKRECCRLPDEIAPGNPNLGIMLPYTPVHLLIFYRLSRLQTQPSAIDALVMTSANRSSEPIYFRDDEAVDNLSDIADYFLTNDRDIYIRTDDSVTRVFRDREFIIRRARGYVPFPVTFSATGRADEKLPSVLACGGELKNTFCINKNDEFYISHHIGDLENSETLSSFEQGIEHFKEMFKVTCDIIAYDLHPEYLSTKYAEASNIKNKLAVQHHHAHIASCMAENGLNEDVIGVAFDGTGYGEDGHIWGGEFFTGSYGCFKRAAHLEYVRMPGGEAAIKEPWRMAASYLYKIDKNTELLSGIPGDKIDVILQMIDRNINSPLTSSAGRLFDAVSALLGIKHRISYEGQAAIELENIAQEGYHGEYGFDIYDNGGIYIINANEIVNGIIGDIDGRLPRGMIAAKFHETAANMVLETCNKLRNATGLAKVVLSGGVFQNMILLGKCVSKLEKESFKVYIHSRVPSNDGGISFGQAVIAAVKYLQVNN